MTLQLVKPISLTDIYAEFGAPVGTPLSAFVRGGAWVPDTVQNAGVPLAKPIALTDLLGASIEVPEFEWRGGTSFTVAGVGTVGARLFFQSDGDGSDDFPGGNFDGWWSVTDPGVGTGKFVRWNHQSGDSLNLGSPQDTWIEIVGTPSFGLEEDSGGVSQGIWNVEFSFDGVGVDFVQPGVQLTADAS